MCDVYYFFNIYIMIISFIILIVCILLNIDSNINANFMHKLNLSEKVRYDFLFNSLEYDYYNLSLIYNKSYNSIKIKHKSKNKKKHEIVCIFGVLVNDKGLEIERSMLKWLLKEYDVYCIYQKYPGILYEYPALRFAQWLSITYHISIILYVHTKGAFNNFKKQEEIIKLWMHEFTNPRKHIYINYIKRNLSDISCPFRKDTRTFFNGIFISVRAFKLINRITYFQNRYDYENLFRNKYNIEENIFILLCIIKLKDIIYII